MLHPIERIGVQNHKLLPAEQLRQICHVQDNKRKKRLSYY